MGHFWTMGSWLNIDEYTHLYKPLKWGLSLFFSVLSLWVPSHLIFIDHSFVTYIFLNIRIRNGTPAFYNSFKTQPWMLCLSSGIVVYTKVLPYCSLLGTVMFLRVYGSSAFFISGCSNTLLHHFGAFFLSPPPIWHFSYSRLYILYFSYKGSW